ncbi:MAG: nitrogenase component 1 [Desulfovibrionales bacterium]
MKNPPYVSTTNACKLCRPLGAAVAFKGIEGCVPFLHGSQGCATYMRRYIISHFREPVDIASSSLGEKQAVYGGGPNLKRGILNVVQKYGASVVGVATTCLTETIGDDVNGLIREFKKEFGDLNLPTILAVSTPSFDGTHMEGFHGAVKAAVTTLAEEGRTTSAVTIFPGFVSAADIRYLKEVAADFGIQATILPDYSETLDGPILDDYEKLPQGGTPVEDIRAMSGAPATIELGSTLGDLSAGNYLKQTFKVDLHSLGLPIGLRESDAFFAAMEGITGTPIPRKHELERGRLVDAMVDGHKYIAGKRAIVYGEEDMAIGLTAFLAEIGIVPVLVASGGESGRMEQAVCALTRDIVAEQPEIVSGVDFFDIADRARDLAPDLVIGNSKGYRVLARELGIPLIRTGFPIHDRIGAQRVLHLGYRGAQELFDLIVNAVLEKKQEDSDVGYGYI